MAGYTAANNLLGFLYVSVNSITQACMSFTSQNYGVGKLKRMDRVLADCMILSVVVAVALGCICYGFGPKILQIYTEDAEVIACGMEILAYTTITYFLCGWMDLFRGADGVVGHRNGWYESGVDFWHFSIPQITGDSVYILSSVVDYHDCPAGNLFLLCETESAPEKSGARRTGRLIPGIQ